MHSTPGWWYTHIPPPGKSLVGRARPHAALEVHVVTLEYKVEGHFQKWDIQIKGWKGQKEYCYTGKLLQEWGVIYAK